MAENTPTALQFVDADPQYLRFRNTFRRGDKYAELRPGDLISPEFVDSSDDAIAVGSTLVVEMVAVGPLSNLILRFAEDNHGVTEAVFDRKIDSNEFAQRLYLFELLRSIYGEDVDQNDVFTVIYFSDLAEEDEELVDAPDGDEPVAGAEAEAETSEEASTDE